MKNLCLILVIGFSAVFLSACSSKEQELTKANSLLLEQKCCEKKHDELLEKKCCKEKALKVHYDEAVQELLEKQCCEAKHNE